MKIGIACDSFFSSFSNFYPKLKIVKSVGEVKDFDLIILSGGEDINPQLYGKENTHSVGINDFRDTVEVEIVKEALRLSVRLFGVCRGHQLINAILGGALEQDLYHGRYHQIRWIEANHLMVPFYNTVNSLHHQGYYKEQMAPSLKALAVEPQTGIVEVACGRGILTTQFHPEWLKSESFFKWLQTYEY